MSFWSRVPMTSLLWDNKTGAVLTAVSMPAYDVTMTTTNHHNVKKNRVLAAVLYR